MNTQDKIKAAEDAIRIWLSRPGTPKPNLTAILGDNDWMEIGLISKIRKQIESEKKA